MGSCIGNFFRVIEKLDLQSTGSPCLSVILKDLYPLAALFHIWGIEDFMGHLQKLSHTSSATLVQIAKVIAIKRSIFI